MNNPIILLVVWFIINLLIKSSKDKKKIEEAKRRRAVQVGNRTGETTKTINTSKETFQRDVRKTISTLREEIEKQKKTSTIDRKPAKVEPVREKPSLKTESVNFKTTTEIKTEEKEKPKLKVKDEIIRGIIYSEVLSEPKSIQNLKKRSI